MENPALPLTVDEFMRSEWGPSCTREEAEACVELANKTAVLVEPDSILSVPPAENLNLCGSTHPMSSGLSYREIIQSSLEEEVRRIAPPREFLQRGRELIGTKGRGCLRWPGQRSVCKLVGLFLGGPDSASGWQWLEGDRSARAIVASIFVKRFVRQESPGYVEGPNQLLDPNWPERWGLLRTVASELYGHAFKAENESDQATREYHLGACWAWCCPPAHTPR